LIIGLLPTLIAGHALACVGSDAKDIPPVFITEADSAKTPPAQAYNADVIIVTLDQYDASGNWSIVQTVETAYLSRSMMILPTTNEKWRAVINDERAILNADNKNKEITLKFEYRANSSALPIRSIEIPLVILPVPHPLPRCGSGEADNRLAPSI
jgi:hypothetical protein